LLFGISVTVLHSPKGSGERRQSRRVAIEDDAAPVAPMDNFKPPLVHADLTLCQFAGDCRRPH
jgi:hypothetical protein